MTRMTSDEALLHGGGGKNNATQASPRRRLLWPPDSALYGAGLISQEEDTWVPIMLKK